MIRKIFLIFICMTSIHVSARQVVTGVLTDKETSKPVEGASVELLLMPDSSTVETSQTTSEGLFIFYKTDTVSTYCLRVKHLIYKTLTLSVIPKKKSMINNVGSVSLEPNMFNLKEIVVNGFKVSVTELGDRTVYGIPEGIQKTSTDGLDLLRKVPSVQVDYLYEDITVNGKSNIKIEVDGITRDKGYLKRLHPTQISKMEVITSPSGKYDAEVDAVINIITNPAMRFGLKGMAYAGLMPISSNSNIGLVNASLDYGLEKISYYIAANAMTQNIEIINEMNRIAGSDVVKQFNNQMMKGKMGDVNLGFIYDPDEYNDINFNISYNSSKMNVESDSWNYNLNNNINSIFKTVSNSESKNGGLTTSLFYKRKFDKKSQHGLEAELSYFNSLKNGTVSNFQNVYYNASDTSELYRIPWQQELSDTKVQTFTGQTNYTLPFDSLYFFNVGISTNFNKYLTDNTSSLLEASDMNYSDLRLAGYAELSRTFSKGSIKLGSRFESSRVVINSSSPHIYNSILPYVNGFFKFNDDNSIKLAYSRRVIRPSTDQLNPMVSSLDSLTISRGNMDLKPAYRDNFQLTYNWKLTLKTLTFNLSPQLFYEYKSGLIQNILIQNEETKLFESVPTNISNGYEYGSVLAVSSQIGKVMFNSNFRYSFYHINSYLDQIDERSRHGWNWNSFAMCPLPANLQFMAMLNLNGPVLDGQTETKTSAMYLVGLGKQFKNNSVLRLMIYNPFAKNFVTSKSTIQNDYLYQTQSMYLKKDYGIMLLYVYSFKVGKTIERQKRSSEQQTQDNLMKLPLNL